MVQQLLSERIHPVVFTHRRGRPLYIHIVFLLGQLVISLPVFPIVILFVAYITEIDWTFFLVAGGFAQGILTIQAVWPYLRFSRAIRRFLAELIAGAPLDADLATAAWKEAVTYAHRVVGWTMGAAIVIYGIEFVFLLPRIGWLVAVEAGLAALTTVIWFGLVVFVFYLERAMRPIISLTLAAGARASIGGRGFGRLQLGTKLQVLTLALIVVPVTLVGIFAYSQVVALGGDYTELLLTIGLVATAASGAAVLQSFLLVRSVMAPVQEFQRVIDEVGQGNLDVSVRTMTTDELGELGISFNHLLERLRQNEELAAAFGRYVSPTVRDGILGGAISLGGERRDLTILFTDVRGFTAWCEQERPESVIQTLNIYYGFLVRALTQHGGTVTRYTGDGVLALFGAPLDDPDHALHAVQAAWEANILIGKFNDIRRHVGAFELRTGFGIHTGSAVVGSIGTDARAEYTPIGDAANVASRIEGLNKELETAILISDATYQRVADWVVVGKQAETPVKGRTKLVHVVEVVGLQ